MLREGLPYIYVYNIKISEYHKRNISHTFPMTELNFDVIKQVVDEEKVDVLVFDFYEKVRNSRSIYSR